MEPPAVDRRLAPMVRLLVAAVLSLGASVVPLATVDACSCAMMGTPREIVARSAVTFVGTVVEAAPGGDGGLGMPTVRYAFEVERASVATDRVIHVRSLDDPGGAACGFTFGLGERWLVATHRSDAGLETGLCSGNQLADAMPPDDLDRFDELLVHVPASGPSGPEEGTGQGEGPPILPAAVALVAAVMLGAVMWVAFRREVH